MTRCISVETCSICFKRLVVILKPNLIGNGAADGTVTCTKIAIPSKYLSFMVIIMKAIDSSQW